MQVLLSPVHAFLWVWYGPRWLRACFALALLLFLGTGTYYLGVHRPLQKRKLAISRGWHKFDTAAAVGHEPLALEGIADVLAIEPENDLAHRRKAAIEAGSADPDDAGMGRLTIRKNLRENRLPEAEREASKRLAHAPFDWVAHCARATAAFARQDREAGLRYVQAIPDPDHPQTHPDAGGLLTAFRLFREAGRDPSPLRVYLRNVFLTDLGSPSDLGAPAAYKLQRLECYAEAFEPDPQKPPAPGLVSHWAAVSSLADRIAEDALASGDVALLEGLGRVSGRLAGFLYAFRQAGQVTPEQFPDLQKELDDRTAKVWAAVIERDPRNPEGYHGLALLRWRTGDYPAARELVAQGLQKCGEDPQLYGMLATMLRAEDRPLDAARTVLAAAEKHPESVVWWVLAAESSMAARRRDLAISACNRGLQASPGNPWLTRTLARLHLEAGDPHRSLELLNSLGEPALVADAATARMVTRALSASGLGVLLDDFLGKAEKPAREEGSKLGSPRIAVGAYRGILDAQPSAERAVAIADRAGKLLAKWADHPDLLRVRADALAVAAETGEPAWQPIRVAAAVKAYDFFRSKSAMDLDSAASLARLRWKGARRPDLALRDLAPVREAEATRPVPAEALEILGSVLLANDQPAEAIRILEKVRKSGQSTAGGLANLTLAYLWTGNRVAAESAFRAAAELPLTPRDRPDYLTAARALRQETP